MMESVYRPYFDHEFESLIERIHPPRVCIDNDTCHDCTLVKVDSANKHGILLEMVQVLTDLDLVISKSYICSDGGWFMDVFHVTDHLGYKLVDESLLHYIQQALCTTRRAGGGMAKDVIKTYKGREVRPRHVLTEHTALEMTGTDRPGLLSEISAVLAELGCLITAAVAWTHNARAACIIYVEDETNGGSINDPMRLAHVQEQLENVVEAHHGIGERRSVRLTAPAAGQTHTERRLHQLMAADKDYESCDTCDGETQVTIESCREKGYSVVNIMSRDRPKLLFDTVCTLTDMQYVVFHAAVSSEGCMAAQEYYIRHRNGWMLDSEIERCKVIKCLIAAVERRVSHGLRLDVCTKNRLGLLSDVTRVFRENGLSISRSEIGTRGERAVGSFYVTDVSGNDVNPKTVELIRNEIGGNVVVVNQSSSWVSPAAASSSSSSSTSRSRSPTGSNVDDKPKFSLGSLLWSQLERLSNNFGPIRS